MKAIKVILIGTVLSIGAVGCQKEEIENNPMVSVAEYKYHQSMRISYIIGEDEPIYVVVNNHVELESLIGRLLENLPQGECFIINNEGDTKMKSVAKDTVYFETEDPDAIKIWCSEMIKKGYLVKSYYDDIKGVYVGIATIK